MASKNGQPAKPIRMVIADVDGTLVTQEKVLTKSAADAVLHVHQAGIEFGVTSGQPPRTLQCSASFVSVYDEKSCSLQDSRARGAYCSPSWAQFARSANI